MQEMTTLVVFAGFSLLYLKEPIIGIYVVGFTLIAAAPFIVFQRPAVTRHAQRLKSSAAILPSIVSSPTATTASGACRRGSRPRCAATFCAGRPSKAITGDFAEIGTFEGRFFIALALGLAPGEHAVGIDLFDWPNEGVFGRFIANCDAGGLARERYTAWKAQSRDISPDIAAGKTRTARPCAFSTSTASMRTRACRAISNSRTACLHPSGIIALDDMLHPGYPTLITTVLDYLNRHPEMVVMCIVDREDIVAAAKFLICRKDAVALYEQDLMTAFARFHFTPGAHMLGHFTLVLSPQLRDVDVGWNS